MSQRIDPDHVYNILQSHLISAELTKQMNLRGWGVRPRPLRASDFGVIKRPKVSEPMKTPLPEVSYDKQEAKKEVRGMDTTGARGLAAAFRERLAKAKERINRVGESMGSAMDNLERTAEQADQIVKSVEAEAADLQAAVGLLTNGGPPLED